MKNKKLLFFVILLFPALFKLILDFTTINSKKLPYYGPKKPSGTDTIYYTVPATFKTLATDSTLKSINLDTINYPFFAVSFIKPSYAKDNYRMAALSEYAQYKKDKIKYVPFVIVTPYDGEAENSLKEMEKLSVGNPNIYTMHWNASSFDSLNQLYFAQKPFYVDYSFFVLVDKKRNIRGYYDARYVSELKRLTEEYQHLRIKEEKQEMLNTNKIETK